MPIYGRYIKYGLSVYDHIQSLVRPFAGLPVRPWLLHLANRIVLRRFDRSSRDCPARPATLHLLPEIRPLQNRVQRRTPPLTPCRETVLHLGRYFGISLAHNNAVSLHSTKLLAELLLRDVRNCALQVAETQHLAPKQMKEYDKFPASFEETKGCFHIFGGGCRRILPDH